MSTFSSVPSSSNVAVEPSERPAHNEFPLEVSSSRYVNPPGEALPAPLSSSRVNDSTLNSASRSLSRCDLHSDTPPIRVLKSISSRVSISEYAGTRACGNLVPVPCPVDTFARLYIFDWDNTLCPTDWLCELYSRCGQSLYTAKRPCAALCSPGVRSHLAFFESSVRRLLQKCRERGQVAILSNATTIGLIKTLRLLPLVQRTLTELKVQVLSARDMCEPRGLPLEKWKDTALIRLVTAFIHKHPHQKHSIMTVGDQEFEHIALHNAAARLLLNCRWECHPKCIKYVENPSLEALTRQTVSLTDLLDRFADEESGTYWMQSDERFLGGSPSLSQPF